MSISWEQVDQPFNRGNTSSGMHISKNQSTVFDITDGKCHSLCIVKFTDRDNIGIFT